MSASACAPACLCAACAVPVTETGPGGATRRRSLGQNFLLDDDILARIVAEAGVRPGDLVLEIGPGAYSTSVCGAGKRVVCSAHAGLCL